MKYIHRWLALWQGRRVDIREFQRGESITNYNYTYNYTGTVSSTDSPLEIPQRSANVTVLQYQYYKITEGI